MYQQPEAFAAAIIGWWRFYRQRKADPGAQLGQILAAKKWNAGIELLERMMDWNEVLDLLKKADRYFNLGLTLENGWIYLPIDGRKTEIRGSDFKVLRPMKPEEKKKFEVELFQVTDFLWSPQHERYRSVCWY